VPNRGLARARIEKEEIRMAILIKVSSPYVLPAATQRGTIIADGCSEQITYPCLTCSRIEQQNIDVAVAIEVCSTHRGPSGGNMWASDCPNVNVVVHIQKTCFESARIIKPEDRLRLSPRQFRRCVFHITLYWQI